MKFLEAFDAFHAKKFRKNKFLSDVKDNVEIRIKMENSCFIDKESNYSKSIRLLNIIYRCEDGAISNDPPATIIGLEVPPSMILENILFQVL